MSQRLINPGRLQSAAIAFFSFGLLALLAAPYALAEGGDYLLRHDLQVNELLSKMTLPEKIGQMTQAELSSLKYPLEIRELAIGSVLSGGDSDPKQGNTLEAWTDAYDACQREALATRLGVPLLYGIDAVHGHNNVENAVVFPHNVGLGCTNNPELVEEVSRITALEVRATGIQWAFAPCVTVPQDDRWGRTYEGYSENTEIVSRLGAAAVRGLQGTDLSDPLRVLGCAKHFAADGGTLGERKLSPHGGLDPGVEMHWDQGDSQIDDAALRGVHIPPYKDAIAAGVASIMPSYSSVNGVKCTGNRDLLTGLLKEELGFEGFLISDYSAIDQVDPDYKRAIQISINAGIDMAMVPNVHRKFIETLTELVNEGAVPIERIDDAVRRILRVKAAMGMLDPGREQLADRSLHAKFGCAEHRTVARRAVRESLVLLKNTGGALPLSRDKSLLICGAAADDLGRQCGGWTVSWQGKSGQRVPGGTSILQGIREAAGPAAKITYAPDADGAEGAEVIVAVVGEPPYAESLGDSEHLGLPAEDARLLDKLKSAKAPVVLVLLSGRPLPLAGAIESSEAVIAGWLPGSEGQGVADVLFGDYPFQGKLAFTWPKSADQHPINGSDAVDAQFPLGFGLTE